MKKNPGEIEKDEQGFRIQFVRHFDYPVETVWEAITDPEKIKIWFTDIEMDFNPGGKMKIFFRDKAHTESNAVIQKIEAPRMFVYTWEDELAEWELIPDGKQACRLIFTYSRIPDEYARSVPAGWHMILDQLETVLNGHVDPYPFGGEETSAGKAMESMYGQQLVRKFPDFKTSK